MHKNQDNNQKQRNNNQDKHQGSNSQKGEKNNRFPTLKFDSDLYNSDYVRLAENVIKHLNSRNKILTTTQIRNLLSLNSEIYNTVIIEKQSELSDRVKGKLQYLKVRMVYESGRTTTVKDFVENAHLIECLDGIGDSKDKYLHFARYLEALVAFRKYIGKGKDK